MAETQPSMTVGTETRTDPPGTCHAVGCPLKGKHAPHGIGAGTWQDYTRTDHCLGYPQIKAGSAVIYILCSLGGDWTVEPRMTLTPTDMAELVDQHKTECTNRSTRG